MASITSRSGRAKLGAAKEPYWRTLRRGVSLGYRKPKAGAGNWIGRFAYINDEDKIASNRGKKSVPNRQNTPSDEAWRRVKAYRGAAIARQRFLTVIEARALIAACVSTGSGHEKPEAAQSPSKLQRQAPFADLVRAGLFTGCRLGELLALRSQDVAQGSLHIAHSKSGHPRDVILTEEGIALFARLTEAKGGAEAVADSKEKADKAQTALRNATNKITPEQEVTARTLLAAKINPKLIAEKVGVKPHVITRIARQQKVAAHGRVAIIRHLKR